MCAPCIAWSLDACFRYTIMNTMDDEPNAPFDDDSHHSQVAWMQLGTKPNMASFLFRAHSASTKRHDQCVNVCYRTNFISNLLCPAICNPHFFGPVSIFLACFHPSPVLFFLCSFSSPCEVSPFHMPVLPCMFIPFVILFSTWVLFHFLPRPPHSAH